MSLKLKSFKKLTLYTTYNKEAIVSILSTKLYYLITLQISHISITLTVILLNIERTQLIIPLRPLTRTPRYSLLFISLPSQVAWTKFTTLSSRQSIVLPFTLTLLLISYSQVKMQIAKLAKKELLLIPLPLTLAITTILLFFNYRWVINLY